LVRTKDTDANAASGAGGDSGDDCGHDLRCICRSLVARRRGAGIELKCRRCRRVLLLEFASRGRIEVSVLES
jgi:hypothetical protein